jgi:DNA-binding MarR family transcriptional regulator
MTQEQIAKILEDNYPKYLNVQDIVKISGYTTVNVYRNLRSLKKRGEVEINIIFIENFKGIQKQSYRINPEN